ncbi:MAG: DUF86 domain-containing protein [Magnetospirillum sp. WYHS-4]
MTDISDAIKGINSVIAAADFATYADSWGMQRAVERGLEITSEASRHIPDDVKALASEIPWRQIAAIGNLLRHEYQKADALTTWNIVKEHLPKLHEATERLIAEIARQEGE